jgi:hypothetical protein
MSGADVSGRLNAEALKIGGSLLIRSDDQNKGSFKDDVILNGAKVTGQVDMTGASVAGTIRAADLNLDGDLHMQSDARNVASFKDVELGGANIKGQVDMSGASFGGNLTADSAKIAGHVDMSGARFDGNLDANSLPAHPRRRTSKVSSSTARRACARFPSCQSREQPAPRLIETKEESHGPDHQDSAF